MSHLTKQNWTLFLSVVLIGSCPMAIKSQDPSKSQLPAPPPMKFVSRDERSQLTATRDPKSRLKLTMELAEQHLSRAQQLTEEKKYDAAAEEVGAYLGLIDDARDFIGEMNQVKNSTRDLYRHLDLKLRAHLPRLAVMRRLTPAEYAVNIKAAEEHARDARSEALESFYGHTVLRDASQKKSDKPNDQLEQSKHP
jgi:hypothetical protein